MLKKHLLIGSLVLAVVLLAGCAAEPAEDQAGKSDNIMGRVDQPLPVDGLKDGYPADPLETAGAVIHLAYDEQYLYVHLEAEVEGWIAVGFNQRGGGMNGANMILGYFSDSGAPAFRNDLGQARNHSAVGVSAVDQFHLVRADGKTTLEFSYPLTFPSGEGFNLEELTPGEIYSLIVAMHRSSDNIGTQHSARGTANFQVQP
jgi:hypothetical protein